MRYFTDLTWRQVFPYDTFREHQEAFIDDLSRNLLEYRANIIAADNGFGKTALILAAVLSTPCEGVYITTRTQRQIEHFVEEILRIIKKVGKDIPFVQMTSKKHLCVNPVVKAKDPRFMEMACQHARHFRTEEEAYCTYKSSSGTNRIAILSGTPKGAPINADIPNLLKYCRDQEVCPYYLARAMSKHYPLTFCAYNYILDPWLRELLDINVKGKLIILDECHNCIGVMEEAQKREITTSYIDFVIELGKFPEIIQSMLSKAQKLLREVLTYLEGRDYCEIRRKDYVELLEKAGITSKFIGAFKAYAVDWLKYTKNYQYASHLANVLSFFDIFERVEERSFLAYAGVQTEDGKRIVKMGVQSLDISPIIHSLIKEGARLVFMSGTLNPEMFKFRLKLEEGKHCCTKEYTLPNRQLLLWQLSKGIDRYDLSTSYTYRENVDMISDYGHTIHHILPHITGGIILFFPSYDIKDKMLTIWNDDHTILKKGGEFFFIYPEDKRIRIYNDVPERQGVEIKHFKERTLKEPAVLAAVFRSRASEGEDYVQEMCRAIFILGVPLARFDDAAVKVKRDYYDRLHMGYGEKWYNTDAMEAVNQACGRGIRDSENDYCVIFLMDKRYLQDKYFNHLSLWIRHAEVVHRYHHTADRLLPVVDKFFQMHDAKWTAKKKELEKHV